MPRVRADVNIDADQGQRKTYMLCCPNCRQKLADVEGIRGIVEMRFMCRRCGKYIKAEIVGVEDAALAARGTDGNKLSALPARGIDER